MNSFPDTVTLYKGPFTIDVSSEREREVVHSDQKSCDYGTEKGEGVENLKNSGECHPASTAGVGIKGGVGGESVSSTSTAIGSHMPGPITMKLSGIDQGNSVSVLGRVRGRMIQDS